MFFRHFTNNFRDFLFASMKDKALQKEDHIYPVRVKVGKNKIEN